MCLDLLPFTFIVINMSVGFLPCTFFILKLSTFIIEFDGFRHDVDSNHKDG